MPKNRTGNVPGMKGKLHQAFDFNNGTYRKWQPYSIIFSVVSSHVANFSLIIAIVLFIVMEGVLGLLIWKFSYKARSGEKKQKIIDT